MSSNPDEKTGSSSPSSPREERVGRGPRRGETNKNAPPLPSPLLHPMEEREKSRSLMQPWGITPLLPSVPDHSLMKSQDGLHCGTNSLYLRSAGESSAALPPIQGAWTRRGAGCAAPSP